MNKDDKYKNKKHRRDAGGSGKNTSNSAKHQNSWYENYPLNGLINANFGRRKGISEIGLSETLAQPIVSAAGIRTYLTIPNNENSGYKQAINIMYAALRSANTGSTNYKVIDLEKYVQHIRTIHAGYCTIRRAYAILNNVSLYDATTPISYLAAMGLDYETFAENAADIKMFGDRMSNIIHKLCPLNIDLINRTRWLFSNGFKDEDSVKATPYFFSVADCIYFDKYLEKRETQFGDYGISDLSSGMEWEDLRLKFQDVMDAFMANNVFQVIAGDMLKAYGEKALYPVDDWGINMPVPVIYDEAALTQIQNATLLPENSNANYVNGEDGFISCTITGTWQFGQPGDIDSNFVNSLFLPCRENQYINTYKDSVSSGELLSYTRLKTMCGVGLKPETNEIEFVSKAHGTEVVDSIYLVCYVADTTNVYNLQLFPITGIIDDTFIIENEANTMYDIALTSQMNYFPMVSYVTLYDPEDVTENDTYIKSAIFWDFNNYAKVTVEDVLQYHDYAAMSLMYTDQLIKQNKLDLVK